MPSAAAARSKTKPAAKKKTPAKPAAAHVASPPAAPAAVKATSSANAIADKTQSLQTFDLLELAQYTPENSYANNASKDFHLFYVGRDDVHDILKHVLSRVRVSLYLNMFGYDDDELNQIIMQKVMDPSVTVLITLDKSQSNGVHEKNLIALDQQKGLAQFNSHFVVGTSETNQISHTKGFVADGRVGGEGSTNWSNSGEGTFVNGTFYVKGRPQGSGYKAQNNTQSIFVDQDTLNRFQAELILEHVVAQKQKAASDLAQAKSAPAPAAPAPAPAAAAGAQAAAAGARR